ncbi:hypothetical protein FNV43_RR07061 [Rhamnella rubrinervis]|uniref:Maternal effect embryo arrest 22 n=1 Tax=Rhamnella rubrinervis TaxID=2594499 RepID=A0A8K0HE76_9ROSA|nr:hypothetical protein FNV43_RR07061 [Rhamnella rubrinervis]
MAADVPVLPVAENPCCALWKSKYFRQKEIRCSLREGLVIVQHSYDKLQKEFEEVLARADMEKENKEKELAARLALENEMVALKSEISSLKQKGNIIATDQNGKVKLLEACVSERENEIERLKKLIEKETKRADSERKNAELEKKKFAEAQKVIKDEKHKADEEKKLGERAEEYRLQLEIFKKEAAEAKQMLSSETVKLTEANKKLKEVKLKVVKEKKRADSERAQAEEQRKLAEANKNKAVEGKCYAESLSQQLEEYRKKIDELEKEIHELRSSRNLCEASGAQSDSMVYSMAVKEVVGDAEKSKLILELSSKLEEANKRFHLEKQKAAEEKARADAEMVKAERQKTLTEVNWKKAMEEKSRADKLSWLLGENNRKIDGLSNKIHELLSYRKLVESSAVSLDKGMDADIMNVKLLKKQLKFEKMQKKLANQVVKLEKSRNSILQHNLDCLKLEFNQLFNQLEMLNKSFSRSAEGTYGLKKAGSFRSLPGLNMKTMYGSESLQTHLQSGDELLKLSSPSMDTSDFFSQAPRHTASFSPVSGVNCIGSITGIDSKLEPLLGGSTAINSSMASFSDGQLVGSQEKGGFSVLTTAKLVCDNSQPAVSNLAGEVTKMRCSENLAVVAESSVRSPVSTGDIGRVAKHSRKRKRVLDAVKSIEHNLLCKKRNTSLLKKLLMQHDRDNNEHEKRDKRGSEIFGYADSPTAIDLVGMGEAKREDISDSVTSDFETMAGFKELADGDYMKLLSLDNSAEEESYRIAIEMPLSPALPEIDAQDVETFNVDKSIPLVKETFCEVLSNKEGKLSPSCRFDVIDVEISSSNSNSVGFGTSGLSRRKCESHVSSLDILGSKNTSKVETTYGCLGGDIQMTNAPILGDMGANFPFQSELGSAGESILVNCVVSKQIEDRSSISKIYFAIRTCIERCSLVTQRGWMMQEILLALKTEDLLPKEKVSVFFSLLLLNFSSVACAKFGSFLNWASNLCLDSFARHVQTVMSDVEICNAFAELFCLDELLSLIEDFLIDRHVMVFEDCSSGSLIKYDLGVHMLHDNSNIKLSSLPASVEQLVAGCIILASICTATDHVGFICETSYNILRTGRFNKSLVMTILHVFAHLGGEEFFSLSNYSLMMTVLKSLVGFLEATSSLDATACIPSTNDGHTEFSSCVNCPFLKDYIPVDTVTLLLLETIKIYALSGTICKDAIEPVDLLNPAVMLDKYKTEQSSGHERNFHAVEINESCLSNLTGSANQSDGITCMALYDFNDLLSLLELVACCMGWEWAHVKVVPPLLKLLESCMIENFTLGIIVLLGQLGRLGVDALGYENKDVQRLRCNLSAFLHDDCSKKGLHIQIATVTALLGLVSLNFEEIIQVNMKFPVNASESSPAVMIRNWFSLLGKKQQDLAINILQTGGVNSKIGEPLKFSKDGYETHLQVNHLASALLSALLLPSLIKGSPSRIVSVNSTMHIPLKLLPAESGISAVCVSPGSVRTNVTRDVPIIEQVAYNLIPFLFRPREGSRSALFAASDPQIPDYSNRLQAEEWPVCAPISLDCRLVNASRQAHKRSSAYEVWNKTLDFIGPLRNVSKVKKYSVHRVQSRGRQA